MHLLPPGGLVTVTEPKPVKRYPGCPIQIAAADKKLRAALLAEFNDTGIADRVMRVIKGKRG